jgi:membrane-bound metal-dependent hydrolase YbcI (DUF457 family)
MDNIAHTLVGAVIGRSVGDSRIPAPAILGALAANSPDITEYLPGPWQIHRRSPLGMTEHRGLTHSLLGAAIQAAIFVILTGLAISALRRDDRPIPWGKLAALYGAALVSHLLMDWQGSYGLRPFLPWSNQRYYGDWVAIVDPFFWLVPLMLLAWGQTRRWGVALASALGVVAILWLVLTYDSVALWVRIACAGSAVVGVVGWHRHWFGPGARRAAAATALVVLALYTAAQAVTGAVLTHQLAARARARFGPHATYALFTRPGFPFTWDPVMASADTVAGPDWSAPRHLDAPVVRRAMATSQGAAILAFDRFVTADVDSTRTPAVVYLRETRRSPAGRRGFGIVALESPSPP